MGDELLDLVCGPASPLPETYQRYRLVAHLGSGGQAEVYRAVRLCGGVTSASMTVKVFRIDPKRALVDELRSWDKGDAALMDLNNRGVAAICRRADGFYGPPPHRPGEAPQSGNAVPYQIYDYLHGVNLRTYLLSAGAAGPGPRLSAVATLRTLAGILRALHHPTETGATPVLHMDVKPSNVMVLATGEVRLIDFTGARYWRAEEITQIAYTPESGGPEALQGRVGPPYDVHGLGAVAYFLVTGTLPRGPEAPPPEAHPLLSSRPALRAALLAPLAVNPGDRPATTELPAWVDHLAALVRSAGIPEIGVDWAEPESAATPSVRAVGRASVVSGTETDAFQRIERLERELVELRGAFGGERAGQAVPLLPTAAYAGRSLGGGAAAGGAAAGGSSPAGPGVGAQSMGSQGASMGSQGAGGSDAAGQGAGGWPGGAGGGGLPAELAWTAPGMRPGQTKLAPGPGGGMPNSPNGQGAGGANAGGANVGGQGAGGQGAGGGGPAVNMRGRAAVVPKPQVSPEPTGVTPVQRPRPPRPPMRDQIELLKRGGGWTWLGGAIALLGWSVWAIDNRGHNLFVPLLGFVLVLVVAGGLFALLRLVGQLVLEHWLGRTRRTARLAHLMTGLYLALVGVAYLRATPWVISLIDWVQGR